MTVNELIEELKKYPPDLPVYASHDADGIEVSYYHYASLEAYIYIRAVRNE